MKKLKLFFLVFIFILTAYLPCRQAGSLQLTACYAMNLDKLKVYFLQGDYKQAILEGEKVIGSSKEHSGGLDELYYLLGLSYLKDGNYLRASDIFEIILKEFQESKFKQEAKLALGDTYFLKGDYTAAENYYNELIDTKLKPQVYYRLAQVSFKNGSAQAGKEYLEKLRKEFPLNTELKLNNNLYLLAGSSAEVYYSVQVGSFASAANARNLCGKLNQEGFDAYVEEVDLRDTKSYRVKVGKLNSRQEAGQLEEKLAAQGYPTKICP